MVHSALYNRVFAPSTYLGGAKKKKSNFVSLINSKKEFLMLVFANLIFQYGITYYTFVMTPANEMTSASEMKDSKMKIWGIMAALFIVLFAMILIKSPMIKFALFCVFSVLQGILVASIKNETNSQIIKTSMAGAITIFVFMVTCGFVLMGFGIYLTNAFGMILFWALLALIIFQVISRMAGNESVMKKGIAGIGLILFAIFIVYDTNTILQRDYYGDFITASMDYYLDIMNIFLDLVTLNSDN